MLHIVNPENHKVFSCTGLRPLQLMWYPFVCRPAIRLYVYRLTKTCSYIACVTKCHRHLIMVLYCWTHGLAVHVQFWSSTDPMGPHKRTWSKTLLFLVCLIIVLLYCRIHYLVVHVPDYGSAKMPWDPRRGLCVTSSSLFVTTRVSLETGGSIDLFSFINLQTF